MNWNEKLQEIIDYIEEHIQCKEEPIDKKEIEKMAGCSFSFFQKIFSYMTDVSFAQYIRNRKLTLAGFELKASKIKVIDLSYKYGYDSPTSFTKAFQQFHGVTPKEARENDVELKVYPKMKIHSNSKYSWRLERKGKINLIGKKFDIKEKKDIAKAWNDIYRDGTFAELIAIDEGEPQGVYGVVPFEMINKEESEYYIMVESNKTTNDKYSNMILDEQTWVVIDCYGFPMKAIQDGWNYLVNEWLVKYPFSTHAICPEIEWYSNQNIYEDDYLSQIWIPIIEE